MSSYVMWIASINSIQITISSRSIVDGSRWYITLCFFLANRLQFMVTILESIMENDRSQTNPIHQRNERYPSFKICFEGNKYNQVCQDKCYDFGINHRMSVSVIVFWRTIEFLFKIPSFFKTGFFKFKTFERNKVKNNRRKKISINGKSNIENFSNNKSREKRQDPNGYPQPKKSIIFNKDDVHFVLALFSVTIPFLNDATKSKPLLFTQYFLLLPIGLTASILGNFLNPFGISGLVDCFSHAPSFTHRICGQHIFLKGSPHETFKSL